jgi:DNA-binding NtrC family response regulator
VPPLRERKEDIPLLTTHFVAEFTTRVGRQIESIDGRAIDRLIEYEWPGNVRELANVLERAVILCRGSALLPEHIGTLASQPGSGGRFPTLEEMERDHILQALERTGGVLAGPNGAAQLLGLNRSTLWSRMQKLGINRSKT